MGANKIFGYLIVLVFFSSLIFTQNTFAEDKKNSITVTRAIYQAKGTNSLCDATNSADVKACNGQITCLVLAGNQLCGDPHVGKFKDLTITYKCANGKGYAITALEGTAANLDCSQ